MYFMFYIRTGSSDLVECPEQKPSSPQQPSLYGGIVTTEIGTAPVIILKPLLSHWLFKVEYAVSLMLVACTCPV